jgi:dTDP-L-rhamnose 4-epimerase
LLALDPPEKKIKVKVLITGGAGFIGRAVAFRLLADGCDVTILDNLSPQIHGENAELDSGLSQHVRLVRGDVRDESAWKKALTDQEVVVHLAAETGTGQSMYRVRHYTDVNIGGTSTLMELLLTGKYGIRSIVVASSRAVYGEGAYRCSNHSIVYPSARSQSDMKSGQFEPKCPECGQVVAMVPTSENAPFHPASMYGLTKQVQEQLVLMYAAQLDINCFALRYQNVYGPGQSLKNPYTGILAIFSNQARMNGPIYIFEDGKESRDLVYIDDVVEATARCIKASAHSPVALNVGTGVAISISRVVETIMQYFGSNSEVFVNGAFRHGDIRHNCADVSKLRRVLGFCPSRKFEKGIQNFLAWTDTQRSQQQSYEQSLDEMRQRGLMHG